MGLHGVQNLLPPNFKDCFINVKEGIKKGKIYES